MFQNLKNYKNNIAIAGILLLAIYLAMSPIVDQITTKTGVKITGFMEGPAQEKLQLGEAITNIDGQQILTNTDFRNAFTNKNPGDTIIVNNKEILLAGKDTPRLGVYVEQMTDASIAARIMIYCYNAIMYLGIILSAIGTAILLANIWMINLLNLFDIGLTSYALQNGALEMNPLANFLITNAGMIWMAAIKIIVVLLASLVLYYLIKKQANVGRYATYTGVFIYTFVVLSNVLSLV